MNTVIDLRKPARGLFGVGRRGEAKASPFSTREVVRALYSASIGVEPDEAQLAEECAAVEADPAALTALAVRLRETAKQTVRQQRRLSDHSQYGEFGILLRELVAAGSRHGMIVDVGANGIEGSNSFDLLADFGWKALLIEANPQLSERILTDFEGLDCELVCCAVGLASGRQTLHLGIGDQISSLNPDSVLHWGDRTGGIEVEVRRLADILDEHRVPTDFDVLSIDVEGLDAEILNDLVATSAYRPRWIIAEVAMPFHGNPTLADTGLSAEFAAEYELAHRTLPNLILRRR